MSREDERHNPGRFSSLDAVSPELCKAYRDSLSREIRDLRAYIKWSLTVTSLFIAAVAILANVYL